MLLSPNPPMARLAPSEDIGDRIGGRRNGLIHRTPSVVDRQVERDVARRSGLPLATVGGYGLAKYDFPGRRAVFATVIGAVAVPGTALAVPTFLMFSKMGLTNTPWSVIIPSLISPFGLYLMWTFAEESVPKEILEAARVDGAGELRTFLQISLRLLAPGMVTVLLFTMVATWNNYFLPLIMLKDPRWYPLTLGLNAWNRQAATAGGEAVFNLVITGSLLTIIPLIAAFLLLQRYWQSGLAAGSVKQ